MTKQTYDAQEISEILGTSKAYAYKLIQRLNSELSENGKITVAGKISKAYFEERVLAVPVVMG